MHRPPVKGRRRQIPYPDVPGSYQSAGKAMRLEILLEELLDRLCACSLVIALDLDSDLVVLLDSKAHQSKELSHIAALVALPDSDLGAELLGLFDKDANVIDSDVIASYHGPVLLVHGTEDLAVPIQYSIDAAEKWFEARGFKINESSRVLKDGKTFLVYFQEEIAGFAIHLTVQK